MTKLKYISAFFRVIKDRLKRRKKNLPEAKPGLKKRDTSKIAMAKDHKSLESLSKQELYKKAQEKNIKGRATMNKQELLKAIKGNS